MIYSLDLPLYTNGYTIKEFNCIDTPMCAASGCYKNENYFLLGLLLAIKHNWKDVNFDFTENEYKIMNDYKDLLNTMGIQLYSEKINNKEQLLSFIREKLDNVNPVLLLTKYKHLYYSPYYMNDEGNRFHLLIIDGYNTKTGIIKIRDSATLNQVKLLDDDVSVLFPSSLKEDDVWEIFQKAEQEVENIYFLQPKYTLIGFENVLEIWKKHIKDGNNSFEHFTRNYAEFDNLLSSEYEYFYKRYVGNIMGIFKIIRFFCEKENYDFEEHFDKLQEEFIEKRCKILNILTKYAVSGITPKSTKLSLLADEIIENDTFYLNEILNHCLTLFNSNIDYEYKALDIESEFNNKAFGSPKDNEPDISGNGIFFVMPQNEIEHKLQKNKTFFKLKNYEKSTGYDNISCLEQCIKIENKKCKRISILACSEYGSYDEEISLRKNGKETEKIKFAVSDFYMNPVYNEEIFCSGQTFQRFNDGTKQLDFTSKIFEYRLYPKNTGFDEIILPKRKNIHIFAITLCY